MIPDRFFLEKTKYPRVWKLTGVFPSKNIYFEAMVTSPKRKPPLKEVLDHLKEQMEKKVMNI